MFKTILYTIKILYFYFITSKKFEPSLYFKIGVEAVAPVNENYFKNNRNLKIVLGPQNSWPDIQQTLRLIKKYPDVKVLLVLDSRLWTSVNADFKEGFYNWLSLLFNRYDFPRNIIHYQILDRGNNISFMNYRDLIDDFIYLIQNKVPKVNQNIISYENLVFPSNSKMYFVRQLFEKKVKYFSVNQFGLGPKNGWKKIFWPYEIYKVVRYFAVLQDKIDTSFLLNDKVNSGPRLKALSFYIANLVLKQKFQIIFFEKIA